MNTPLISFDMNLATPSMVLSCTLPVNPSQTATSHAPSGTMLRLYVADKVQTALVARLLQQRVSLLAERIALGVLRAVVDKADARA